MNDEILYRAYKAYSREDGKYKVCTSNNNHLLNANHFYNQAVGLKSKFCFLFTRLKDTLYPRLNAAEMWVYVPELKGTILSKTPEYDGILKEIENVWKEVEKLYGFIEKLKKDENEERFLYEEEQKKIKEREALKRFRKAKGATLVVYPDLPGIQLEISFSF